MPLSGIVCPCFRWNSAIIFVVFILSSSLLSSSSLSVHYHNILDREWSLISAMEIVGRGERLRARTCILPSPQIIEHSQSNNIFVVFVFSVFFTGVVRILCFLFWLGPHPLVVQFVSFFCPSLWYFSPPDCQFLPWKRPGVWLFSLKKYEPNQVYLSKIWLIM